MSTRAPISDASLRRIARIAEAAEAEVRGHLPELEDELRLVVDLGPDVIPETGETGAAIAPGVVGWTIDPNHPPGLDQIAERHLRHTLFHELHHLVRGWTFHGAAPSDGFVHGVVCEGMATAFARDAAGEQAPWATYPEDVEEWVKELLELPMTPTIPRGCSRIPMVDAGLDTEPGPTSSTSQHNTLAYRRRSW